VPSIEPELLANINMLNMFIAPLWLGAEAPNFVEYSSCRGVHKNGPLPPTLLRNLHPDPSA
jgi:hypothetical protein